MIANSRSTLCILAAFCLSGARGYADSALPVELTPYRVQISIAFAGGPEATPAFRRELLDEVRRRVGRAVGGLWSVEIVENSSVWPANRVGLERLSETELPADPGEALLDKIYLLAVDQAGPLQRLSGREWDAATRRLGPVQSVEVPDPRAIAEEAIRLIARLFHPVLAIETIDPDGRTVHLRLRGGALLAAGPEDEVLRRQIRPGDLLQPFLRYLDRDRRLREVQQIPWTYLLVENVERGRVTGTIVSGLRAPLGTGAFRRVEPVALGVRPQGEATSLRLLARDQPPRPMAGFKVRVVPKTHAHDEPQGEETTLLTDRSGRLHLAADAQRVAKLDEEPEPGNQNSHQKPAGGNPRETANARSPLVWLYIQSGEALLARVPFVPGVEKETAIELPDDSLRLATEGEIDLLKGRLIDTVARRAALIARIRKLAGESDWTNVDALRKELASLPGVREFQSQLNAIRVPALEKASARKDRLAGARIRQLCDDAADLIRRYLDPDTIRALNEEIAELRRLDAGT